MKEAHSFIHIEPHPTQENTFRLVLKVGVHVIPLAGVFTTVVMAGKHAEKISEAIGLIQQDAGSKRAESPLTPTVESIIRLGVDIGLPEIEARKFFQFYESKGWMVGKNRMKSVNSALAGWKLRWQDRKDQPLSPNMEAMIRNNELKRVEAEIATLESDAQYTALDQSDKERKKLLYRRKKELLSQLGMIA